MFKWLIVISPTKKRNRLRELKYDILMKQILYKLYLPYNQTSNYQIFSLIEIRELTQKNVMNLYTSHNATLLNVLGDFFFIDRRNK